MATDCCVCFVSYIYIYIMRDIIYVTYVICVVS